MDHPEAVAAAALPARAQTTLADAVHRRGLYVLLAGCAWDMLPEEFPPVSTVYRWFARFRDDGTWETINHHLVMRGRERVGREASPSAAVLDSQSVMRLEGAHHLWRKVPSGELSIDPEADERCGWATGLAEAS